MKKKSNVCFLCCRPIDGKGTKEHFVSRCFYLDRKLPNDPTLQLPAHQECNGSTSADEEWVAVNFGLAQPGAKGERWERAIRALTMDRPAGRPLAQSFMAKVLEVPGGVALPVGADRLTWVIGKIVKGLCYREWGVLLDENVQWTLRVCPDELRESEDLRVLVELPANEPGRGGVLAAKGAGLPDKGLFIWVVVLVGMAPLMMMTTPREGLNLQPGAEGKFGFTKLAWPKPRHAKGAKI